jgi:hypothetical protein
MCDEKLVTVDESHQIELSVCSTVTAHSTGTDQGFQKCSSSSKHTKNVYLHKMGILCNSERPMSKPYSNSFIDLLI